MDRRKATGLGLIAILLWALLALLTVGSAPVPPFQLNAICFAIAAAIGIVWTKITGGMPRLRRVPPAVYVFGTLGLFGYHALYFSALRLAPPAEAGLIAYLWPLLIVLFSGLLPGERLGAAHILGAVLGFSGAALLIGKGVMLSREGMAGYGLALLCALTWSGYSVLSRRLGAVPTDSVAVFCAASAVLSLAAHIALETTVWPAAPLGWLSVALLGLGPVGLTFFCLGYRDEAR